MRFYASSLLNTGRRALTASKALRSYVQHVLVEMDDVDVDSQVLLCIDWVCLQPCAPLSRALTGAGFHGGCMPQALGGARHGGV